MRFEDLVAQVFSALGFGVQQSVTLASDDERSIEADLILTSEGVSSVVEVKFYRSRTPSLADLRRAAVLATHARRRARADHAVLVVSLRRDQLPESEVASEGVILIGLDDLIAFAEGKPELLAALADVSRELNSGLAEFDAPVDVWPSRRPPVALSYLRTTGGLTAASTPLPRKGADLAKELQEIQSGKARQQTLSSGRSGTNWRLFEKVCVESLQYVFDDILGAWETQGPVAGDDKRYDAIAKITGDDVFCRTLIEDFRTRYILFEFKNYEEPVAQNLVYITEKYLFPTALRSTAVVISPQGLDPSAKDAARGALRDAGKLILDLGVLALSEMLVAKDGGGNASPKMEANLDKFLLSLGR